MSKVAVVFWSGTGNTETMASSVESGAAGAGAVVSVFQAGSFTADMVSDFDAFAFGCPAQGAEELEDSEFVPMWDSVKDSLADKKVVLFGSYGWGGGEFMETWKSDNDSVNIVADFTCEGEPDEDSLAKCVELGTALV